LDIYIIKNFDPYPEGKDQNFRGKEGKEWCDPNKHKEMNDFEKFENFKKY
jgi:hypothetical protein